MQDIISHMNISYVTLVVDFVITHIVCTISTPRDRTVFIWFIVMRAYAKFSHKSIQHPISLLGVEWQIRINGMPKTLVHHKIAIHYFQISSNI